MKKFVFSLIFALSLLCFQLLTVFHADAVCYTERTAVNSAREAYEAARADVDKKRSEELMAKVQALASSSSDWWGEYTSVRDAMAATDAAVEKAEKPYADLGTAEMAYAACMANYVSCVDCEAIYERTSSHTCQTYSYTCDWCPPQNNPYTLDIIMV